jgi:hypothetical protein
VTAALRGRVVRVGLKQVKQVLSQEDASSVIPSSDSVVVEVFIIISVSCMLLGNITVLELAL